MIDVNAFHPFPRYGVAAAAVRFPELDLDFSTEESLALLARKALRDQLSGLLLHGAGSGGSTQFKTVPSEKLDPGKKSGQITANSYFIAPHATTNNNLANAVKEIKALIAQLESQQVNKSVALKRSYAPHVAKINAGGKAMSDPKTDVLQAAFTAVAMSTPLKPAAYLGKDLGNNCIIPDLPFSDVDEFPLKKFVELFGRMQPQLEDSAYQSSYSDTDKRFKRPAIFSGNYARAPKGVQLGSVSLLAAIGKWAEEYKLLYPDLYHQSASIMQKMAGRPIYIFSYEKTLQERFGHHLAHLATGGSLHGLLTKLNRVVLHRGEDLNPFTSPEWKHFRRHFDRFLRFFNRSSWVDFLSVRATYPAEFNDLFKYFFMKTYQLPEEVILSAMAYGRSLNRASYLAAKSEVEDDQKKNRTGRNLNEYKNRVLVQLESTIRSAKTHTSLLAQIGTMVGRLTYREIDGRARHFMQQVAEGKLELDTAKNLMIAFMRVNAGKFVSYSATQEEE